MIVHFLIPGSLDQPTGGYGYDRRILAGLRDLGWEAVVHRLGDGFPDADASEILQARTVLETLPSGAVTVIDGLALAGMAEALAAERGRLRLVALMHHPLGDEVGMAPEARQRLAAAEWRALESVDRVIATSPFTARELIDHGVPSAIVTVVPPGTDPAPAARGSGAAAVALLCVATLIPRKGHDTLLSALAAIGHRDWTLACVGSAARAGSTAEALRAQIARLGLADRVRFIGALDRVALDAIYDRSDLFVLASWHEGYGMVFAEALARGLPIVATSGGAVAETVPPDAGSLVPPGDVAGLAAALDRVIGDAALRRRMADRARAAGLALAGWPEMAGRFAAALSFSG